VNTRSRHEWNAALVSYPVGYNVIEDRYSLGFVGVVVIICLKIWMEYTIVVVYIMNVILYV